MADRYLVWHIPTLPAVLPVYYVDWDAEVVALRIYAEVAPGNGDLRVDILDDGVSIMKTNDYQTVKFDIEDGYIEFGTPSSTAFTQGEVVSGTSGASATIKKVKLGRLTLTGENSTKFALGETITGASSAATGVVNSYVPKVHHEQRVPAVVGVSRAILTEGHNSETQAEDFIDNVEIIKGSWVSCALLDAAGAKKITVQLEINNLDSRSNREIVSEN